MKKIFYHGSSDAVINLWGFRLLPPQKTGCLQEVGRKKNLDKVFFTTDPGSARIYAGRAVQRFGGNPVILRVIPMTEIDQIQDKPGSSVYFCNWAFYEIVE